MGDGEDNMTYRYVIVTGKAGMGPDNELLLKSLHLKKLLQLSSIFLISFVLEEGMEGKKGRKNDAVFLQVRYYAW